MFVISAFEQQDGVLAGLIFLMIEWKKDGSKHFSLYLQLIFVVLPSIVQNNSF